MNLNHDILSSYVDLLFPELEGDERESRLVRSRRRLDDDENYSRNTFVALDEQGELSSSCRLARVLDSFYVLTDLKRKGGRETREADVALLREAMARAAELRLTKVSTRPTETLVDEPYRLALVELGFVFKGLRIEYKTPIAELPADEDNPFEWKDMGSVGRPAVVRLLETISEQTDFALEKGEAAEDVVHDWLSDDELRCEDDCVRVGFRGSEPVALVCAQSMPRTGWGTLTFMGIAPSGRGLGLGAAVQRHGIDQLRQQGATEYHGGAHGDNAAMHACFLKNGCREFERMSDWVWTADRQAEGSF